MIGRHLCALISQDTNPATRASQASARLSNSLTVELPPYTKRAASCQGTAGGALTRSANFCYGIGWIHGVFVRRKLYLTTLHHKSPIPTTSVKAKSIGCTPGKRLRVTEAKAPAVPQCSSPFPH